MSVERVARGSCQAGRGARDRLMEILLILASFLPVPPGLNRPTSEAVPS